MGCCGSAEAARAAPAGKRADSVLLESSVSVSTHASFSGADEPESPGPPLPPRREEESRSERRRRRREARQPADARAARRGRASDALVARAASLADLEAEAAARNGRAGRASATPLRRQRAATDADSPHARFQGELSLMRRYYSWDEIPMDFFVDQFVEEERSGRRRTADRVSRARSRLSASRAPRAPARSHRSRRASRSDLG